MKKIKIGLTVVITLIIVATIVVTLLLASTVSIGGGDSEWKAIWEGGLNYYYGTSSGKNYGFSVTPVTASKYNNIYCIEHTGLFKAASKNFTEGYIPGTGNSVDACRYYVSAIVELSSGKAKVKFYKDGVWDYDDPSWSEMTSLNPGGHNYILAAILYGYGDSDRGMWTGNGSGQNYTEQQKALYYYWDTWVDESGFGDKCEAAGLKRDFKCSKNLSAGSEEAYNNYANIAKSINCDIRLYVLGPSVKEIYQDLIVARRFGTSTREKEKISIKVTKEWIDSDNAYKNRPSSITVKLYKDGSDTGKSLTLNSGNGWSGTFSDLDDSTGYSVKETSVPNGYKSSSPTGNQSSGFTITNTLQYTSVTVKKVWDDDENSDGSRPTSVSVTLYENGTATSKTATLSSSNSWKFTFDNLPKYKNGEAVIYTVHENVPIGYIASVDGNASKRNHNNK